MRKKETINEAFNYSYEDSFIMEDVHFRHLYLNSEVDENIVNNIIYHIIRYNVLDKELPVDQRQPIKLYINSPGGNMTDGFALVDAISVSKTPVHTINIGLAASAACYIYMAGKRRFAMPRSEFLLHEAFVGELGHLSKIEDSVSFMTNEIGDMIREFVLSHSAISKDCYDSRRRTEWYMLPGKAQEYGIVDIIIGKDCSIDAIL